MIKNSDVKTSPKQRIFFALVAVFLLATTFMLYAGMVLTNNSQQSSANSSNEFMTRYNAWQTKRQAEIDAYGDELSAKYFDTFKPYKDKVKAYNAADVTDIIKKDYVIGDGEEIADGTTDYEYSAYYIGWLSDGTIFDSSFDNIDNPSKLKFPLEGSGQMVQGWLEGISGMRIGGIRAITMPAVLGYGDTDNGVIPAGSALKFVVMLVPKAEEPEMSAELEAEYQEILELLNAGTTVQAE